MKYRFFPHPSTLLAKMSNLFRGNTIRLSVSACSVAGDMVLGEASCALAHGLLVPRLKGTGNLEQFGRKTTIRLVSLNEIYQADTTERTNDNPLTPQDKFNHRINASIKFEILGSCSPKN